MENSNPLRLLIVLAFAVFVTVFFFRDAFEEKRHSLWVDAATGEPTTVCDVAADAAKVRVVYLGERHTVERHHGLQEQLFREMAQRSKRLALGLEQMESAHQPALDRFNAGQITFDQLAEEAQWAKQWTNFAQYRPVLEAARKAKAPVIALGAPAELIRQVGKQGVAKLDAEQRKKLPADMTLDDPPYERLLGLQLQVHMAAKPDRMRAMIDAQIARDECMAQTVVDFLKSDAGRDRTLVVLCGSGHAAFGLGMPERVRRRMKGIEDLIVLFSESGDVKLSAGEKAVSRAVEINHGQLRKAGLPLADYLHVITPKPKPG